VILTAYAFEENRQEALEAGADEFMRKPVQKEELYAVLEQQLGIHFAREIEAPRDGGQKAAELTAADLASLSAEARTRLTEAVRELNPAKIAAELDQIRVENPELAARLLALAENMQYRQFWQLLGIAGL